MSSFIDSLSEEERQSAINQILYLQAQQVCIKCHRENFKRTEITDRDVCYECFNAIRMFKSGIRNEETKQYWKRHKKICYHEDICWRNLNG